MNEPALHQVHHALYQISELAIAGIAFPEMLARIHGIIQELMPARNFFIALLDESTGMLTFPYMKDEFDQPFTPRLRGRGLTEYVIRTGEPLLAPLKTIQEIETRGEIELIGSPCACWLGVPLRYRNHITGALVVQDYQRQDAYSERDLEVLGFVSAQVAMVVQAKMLEAARRETEVRYHELFSEMLDGFALLQPLTAGPGAIPDYVFQDVNPAFEKLLQQPAGNVTGRRWEEFFSAMSTDFQQKLAAVSRSGTPFHLQEYYLHTQNRYLELKCFPSQQGRLAMVFTDITQRKRAEEDLRHSENHFRSLIENITDLIAVVNQRGVIRYISPSCSRLLGYRPEELLGRRIFRLIKQEDLPLIRDMFRSLLTDPGLLPCLRCHIRHLDGSWRFMESTGSNLLDFPSVRGIVINVRDLTDYRRMEEDLFKARQMESIGVLAGGIAHDFNNILAGILGNISLARLEAGTTGDVPEFLAEAEKACARARDLANQLLTFARGGSPVKRAATVAELVREAATFTLRGSKISGSFHFPEGLWPVMADGSQIGQVIHQLVLNSMQAMPDGGRVQLAGENVELAAGTTLPLKPGAYVRIVVRDEGAGIAEADLPKIFDPYFTTKEAGRGMGLAACYSIIRKHDGLIRAQSRVGEGTTFEIFLPASESASGSPAGKPLPGEIRVLLMDDESLVRIVAGKILEKLGCRVTMSTDGLQAVTLFRQAAEAGKPFDLVILDLTVPGGMGGQEAARELIQIDPGVRLIVSSGYSGDPVMSDYRSHGFSAIVAKPYRVDEMASALHQVLAGRTPGRGTDSPS